ncbi:TorF family putative porin [soil metagenome]
MKIQALAAAAAFAVIATAGAASAQDATISYNIGVTSDYVFRGISQTNEDPAIQGGADVTLGKFYAGVWASHVDFGDSTSAEIDYYGGYRTEIAGFGVDVGIIDYAYTDKPKYSGYNYIEYKAAVSRAVGPVTVGAAVYYSPNFFGTADDDATYVEANASYSPITNLTISGAVGEQYLDVSDDYATWNLGATYAIAGTPLAIDVRYTDTDLDNLGIADGRGIATLKATF